MTGGLLDCCEGEPLHGDPHGLHTFDCPVYERNVSALEKIFGGGDRPTPTKPAPTLAQLVADTELGHVISYINKAPVGSSTDAHLFKIYLVDKLAGREHRKGRRR